MTKTQLIKELVDRTGLTRQEVIAFMASLHAVTTEGLARDGVVVVGDLVRIVIKDIPAKPAGERKGFGGEVKWHEATPATKRLRVNPVKALKDAVLQ